MFTISIGGQTVTNVIGIEFVPRHGFTTIEQHGGSTKFEGYYKDQYFIVEHVHDCGQDLYEFEYFTGDDEELINWIQNGDHVNDKVFQRFTISNMQ